MVKVLSQDGYIRIHGRCFELAEAGLGAVISSELTVGEMATLDFALPDVPEPISVRAVVRHRMGFLHGFEFISIPSTLRDQIRAFCRNLTPA